MRTFSMKSITLAAALTLTLVVAAPSFAAGRQDRDRTPSRDRRGAIERIVDAVRRVVIGIQDIPIVPIP